MQVVGHDPKIVLNIAINLSGVGNLPKVDEAKPITKEDALAVNVAPSDSFLDLDKFARKTAIGLGPIVDGEYFRPTTEGLLAAQHKLKKKRMSDYYDHADVIMARKMLKGG